MLRMGLKEIYRLNAIRLRKDKEWTAEKVAELYGCEPSYIYQIEGGARGIGERTAGKLARVYGVPEEEFIKMPPGIGDPELDRIWQKVYQLQKGHHAELFAQVVDLLALVEDGRAPAETIESLRSQITTYLKILKP